jgi:hypothetical protein
MRASAESVIFSGVSSVVGGSLLTTLDSYSFLAPGFLNSAT